MADGPGEKKQLGKILLKQRLVTQEELDELLAHQRAHPGERLASAAVARGRVTERQLLKALSEQHGVPGIDLHQVAVPLENLRLIPADIAKRHLVLPILIRDGRLFLAMADPTDKRMVDEIEFVTGHRVYPYVALHGVLQEVIDEAYRLLEQGAAYYVGPQTPADYLEKLGLRGDPPPGHVHPPEPAPGRQAGVVVDSTVRHLDEDGPDLDTGEIETGENARPKGSQHPRPEHPTILVVDDEDDIRRLLQRVLTQKGYEVVEASRGFEALQAVRDHTPDVILLDAMLPEVHGFDVCRRIKGSKRYGHIPIVMVSAVYRGWRFAEDLKQSYGVTAFLEKPFKIGDVLSAVESALAGGRPGDEPEDELGAEASAMLEAGMDAYRRGDLEAAVAKLKEGVGVDPLSFQLHYHLGLLHGRRDELFEGIHELETAVDLQPRNFHALKNLAVLYQRAGFRHKAVEMWERALGSAPDDDTRRGIKDHLMSLL
ncbi:MAG: response regulator [Myxococcota bacterium]